MTLAFIGLTCPSVIFHLCEIKLFTPCTFKQKQDKVNTDRSGLAGLSVNHPMFNLIVDVCEALWYTKHAMNFILYTLSGQDFRREFLKLFTQCCHHQRATIFAKLISRTTTSSLQQGPDSSLNERSTILPVNSKRKGKKLSANNQELSSVVLINPKLPSLINQSD